MGMGEGKVGSPLDPTREGRDRKPCVGVQFVTWVRRYVLIKQQVVNRLGLQ
jgi:hypothetical protein